MAASMHSEGTHSTAIRPATGGVAELIEHGMRLRLRAPELALTFGERAASLAEAAGSERLWIQAEGLAVFARIRLGYRAGVVDRAAAALRAAEVSGFDELAALLRTDLALCARSVGAPLTGLAALRPVLTDTAAEPALRVAALLQLVGCMASVGRRGVLDRALDEADQLTTSDSLDQDTQVLLYAMVRLAVSAHLRRGGDLAAALDAARSGLDALDALSDHAADGCQLRIRLSFEVVSTLLDTGQPDEAAATARPLIDAPPRAAAIAPLGWLQLAVATRIHLPAGEAQAAAMLVRDALYYAERHGLDALTARLWLELGHIEEQLGRMTEAVRCLREARAVEFRSGRARRQALNLLIGEFGRGEQPTVDLQRMLAGTHGERRAAAPSVVATPSAAQAGPVADTEPAHERSVSSEFARPTASADQTPTREEPVANSDDESTRAEPARAVLERLGITVSGGGRRRAPDHAAATGADQWRDREPTGNPAAVEESATTGESEGRRGSVAESTAEPAITAATREPRDMDTVLAVFSNWTDDDERRDVSSGGHIPPRSRRRRHDRPPTFGAEQLPVTNGRVVGGDDSLPGRHRGTSY